PSSLEDPTRVVTTSRVAVTPQLTADLKRYVYAVDQVDGSVMVFDVSDGPHDTAPLLRPHPEYAPFSPADRIRFTSPTRDVTILQRDIPIKNPITGVAQQGIRCDPDPAHKCNAADDANATTCDFIGAAYRSKNDHEQGAGPLLLRGMFAFLVLTSGAIAVIDV